MTFVDFYWDKTIYNFIKTMECHFSNLQSMCPKMIIESIQTMNNHLFSKFKHLLPILTISK